MSSNHLDTVKFQQNKLNNRSSENLAFKLVDFIKKQTTMHELNITSELLTPACTNFES